MVVDISEVNKWWPTAVVASALVLAVPVYGLLVSTACTGSYYTSDEVALARFFSTCNESYARATHN